VDAEPDDDRIPALRAQGAQAALIGLPDDPRGRSCVDHDFGAAGALCADHLADLGHRQVAFVGSASGVHQCGAAAAERTLTGLRERAEERGLGFSHSPGEGGCGSAAGALARVLAERPGTTGFVVQDQRALGPLLGLLRAGGRRVPRDASVVALCAGRPAGPDARRLTAVTGSAQELGRVAVGQVLRRIAAVERDEQPQDETVLLAPVLTVRHSTGPAAATGRRRPG
jgi:DNA-binding LacI/PurR family transcriptional regulator